MVDTNNMNGDDTEDNGLSNGLAISGSWIDRSGNNNHAKRTPMLLNRLTEQQD